MAKLSDHTILLVDFREESMTAVVAIDSRVPFRLTIPDDQTTKEMVVEYIKRYVQSMLDSEEYEQNMQRPDMSQLIGKEL